MGRNSQQDLTNGIVVHTVLKAIKMLKLGINKGDNANLAT